MYHLVNGKSLVVKLLLLLVVKMDNRAVNVELQLLKFVQLQHIVEIFLLLVEIALIPVQLLFRILACAEQQQKLYVLI